MPQDVPDAVDPLAPFEGGYDIPGFPLRRRWYDARDLTDEQRDEILALIRRSFNNRVSWFELPVRPEDHFDWKFRDRPTGVTVHTTIDAGDHVVGFTGGMRRIWWTQGRPLVSRGGYDLCLSPDWQGQGVQRAFNHLGSSEWHPSEDIGVGYVTHPADRHLAIEGGNKAPANETHDYVRHLRPLQRVREWLSRRRRTDVLEVSPQVSRTSAVLREREETRMTRAGDIANRARLYAGSMLARRPARRGGDWSIQTLRQFEERHEPFVADALSQFDFVADRSIAYLNWRYCDERGGPFTVRVAERQGEALGFAVTRVFAGTAQIADILARPGRLDVAESLIRDAIALANEGGAKVITTRLPKYHPYRDALVRAGFFDVGHVGGEVIAPRRLPAGDLEFLDEERTRIHHVMGDSDYL